MTAEEAGTFAVYRIRDQDGDLIYVGMSRSVFVRLEQHVRTQSWWSEVAYVDIDWHQTLADATDAELAAIRNESPLYNVQGRGGHAQRRPTPQPTQPIAVGRYTRLT